MLHKVSLFLQMFQKPELVPLKEGEHQRVERASKLTTSVTLSILIPFYALVAYASARTQSHLPLNPWKRWFLVYAYAYSAGAFAQLCDLYLNEEISMDNLHVAQKGYMEDKVEFVSKKQAIDAVLAEEVFKDCPLLRY